MTDAPLLEVEDLSRHYGGGGLFGGGRGSEKRALDGVSFTMMAGEILGIVGESGCGKSTLARLVMALDRPTGGRVLLDGEPLSTLRPRALARRRRDLQMVFQDPYGSLDPRQTVGRIVAEPLHLLVPRLGRAGRVRRVSEMLEAVGLGPEAASRYTHQFSGGQRQRIGIARALITAPKLVVADEPVSALDLSVQAQVLNLILDLNRDRGTAFLFISHNLGVVQAIADRVSVMYRGRIVETGPAASVFAAPRHPYTALLVAAEPAIDDAEAMARPQPHVDATGSAMDWSGCAFRDRCPRASELCHRETPLLHPVSAMPSLLPQAGEGGPGAAEPRQDSPGAAEPRQDSPGAAEPRQGPDEGSLAAAPPTAAVACHHPMH